MIKFFYCNPSLFQISHMRCVWTTLSVIFQYSRKTFANVYTFCFDNQSLDCSFRLDKILIDTQNNYQDKRRAAQLLK